MEGRGPLVRDLTRRLRGADFRQALKAVAELRHLDRAVGAHVISSLTPADEQRAFQLLIARLVAEGGVHGLAARWSDLPSPQWRERLVSRPSGSRHKFSRVIIDGPLSKPGDARQDLVGGLGPDERLRISIMRVDERADGGLQFRHAAMHSAPDLLVG